MHKIGTKQKLFNYKLNQSPIDRHSKNARKMQKNKMQQENNNQQL